MHNITPEQLYQIIGKNVAKYRKAKGLSQLDLSLQMGYMFQVLKFVIATNILT